MSASRVAVISFLVQFQRSWRVWLLFGYVEESLITTLMQAVRSGRASASIACSSFTSPTDGLASTCLELSFYPTVCHLQVVL